MIETIATRPMSSEERAILEKRAGQRAAPGTAWNLFLLGATLVLFGWLGGLLLGWLFGLQGVSSPWFGRAGELAGAALMLAATISVFSARARLRRIAAAHLARGEVTELRVKAIRSGALGRTNTGATTYAFELGEQRLAILQSAQTGERAGFPCLEFKLVATPAPCMVLHASPMGPRVAADKTFRRRPALPAFPELAVVAGAMEDLDSRPGALARQMNKAADGQPR